MKQGKVYLIGAGCGNADLLTLRGKNRLEQCDVIVYDDLIAPEILNFAPESALRIYMGKREGRHSASQSEINQTLVELATQGKIVARLKGGDPFVFGRGGEEILALQQAGIDFEEIPGITSAIAIPAGAGIPVTHRGMSRSVHIITGHTADTPDGLPTDFEHLARCDGTLVFLMGLGKLEQIARRLMTCGRSPDTHAAVISGGNSPNPAIVRGTLVDIAQLAQGVLPPAVIVVGEVAKLELSPLLPLQDVNIGVTGTPRMANKLTAALEELGARVYPLARSRVVEKSPDLRLQALTSPEEKWLVFTSPNAVPLFFRQLHTLRVDMRVLGNCRFAAIGPATAAALEQRGIFPDLVPEQHTSRTLATALTETATPDQPIFLLRSAKGAPVLKELPEQAGFSVVDVSLYDTMADNSFPPLREEMLSALRYLVFSSSGGVEEFFRLYKHIPDTTIPVCIGSVTAAALARHTCQTPILAEDTSAAYIVQAILSQYM